jgi:Tfp pilus assembly protein PilO
MAPLAYKSSLARYSRYLEVVNSRPLWKATLYLILSLSLLIVLLLAALKPTLITIAGLIGQIQKEQEIERQLDAKIQSVTKANQALLEISNRIAILDEALPTKAQIAAWTDSVDRVGNESGIFIPSVVFDGVPIVTDSTTSASYKFVITAEGTYENLYKFIQTLQNLRRLITVTSVAISNQSTNATLQLVLTGTLGNKL